MMYTSYVDVRSPMVADCELAEACVRQVGLVHRKPQATPTAPWVRMTHHTACTGLSDASCLFLRQI